MNHIYFARLTLSILCATQGAAQLAIDLNRTHANHPNWIGHARFHVVWQSVTVALLAGVQLFLIWTPGPSSHAFYLAAALAAVSPCAFLLAAASRKLYGGQFSDPNGIPPVDVALGKTKLAVDMNYVAVVVALFVILIVIFSYRS